MAFALLRILILTVLANIIITDRSLNEVKNVSKVLLRRKRFLIFPEGSSFQLVFCEQNHGYLQIGDVVWFGTTAALAWELPIDPEVYDMFRDKYKLYEANRKSDVIYYTDDAGKIIDQREYRRKIIINPAFAKRSTDKASEENKINKQNIKKMHQNQKNKKLLEELDVITIDLHRQERQKLYAKFEKFLQALGWNGENCVLQLLCHAKQLKSVQGTFFEEIIKAVFTLPKVQVSSEIRNQYDDAHGSNGDCTLLYPNCEESPII